jgi:hypothetical protein
MDGILDMFRRMHLEDRVADRVTEALRPIKAALSVERAFVPDSLEPNTGPWRCQIVRDITEPHRQAALRVIREEMKPAPLEEIDRELVRLRCSTKSREETTDNLTMIYEIYGELCAEYPAKAVRDGLRHLGRAETFWPALHEVKQELDAQSGKLRAISAALEYPERHRGEPREPRQSDPPPFPGWTPNV